MSDNTTSREWPGGADSLWETLARYQAGESPEDEVAAVRQWLAQHPERERELSALDERLARLSVAPPGDVDVEAALARVHARMTEPVVLPFVRPASPAEQRSRSWRSIAVAIAATIVVVLGGVLLWRTVAGRSASNVYATAVGRTASVRLADGTSVWLAPASRLMVPGNYGRAGRAVELNGLALFRVRHDAAHPFEVRSGGGVVRDLGTEFVVSGDSSGTVDVVVKSGSVALSGPAATDTPVVLRPGQRGTLRLNRIVVERARPADTDVAWTRGRLVFEDAPLDRVRADLRRWYGVDLQADPILASRHVTASFAGEPVQQVVDVIALALGARVEWRGTTAILQAARAGTGP